MPSSGGFPVSRSGHPKSRAFLGAALKVATTKGNLDLSSGLSARWKDRPRRASPREVEDTEVARRSQALFLEESKKCAGAIDPAVPAR